MELKLKEGDIARIPGTDLTIEAKKVVGLTPEGCLGGPVGCPDQVQLTVTRGKESEEIGGIWRIKARHLYGAPRVDSSPLPMAGGPLRWGRRAQLQGSTIRPLGYFS